MRLIYDDYNWRLCGGDGGMIGSVLRTWGNSAFTSGYKLIEVYEL